LSNKPSTLLPVVLAGTVLALLFLLSIPDLSHAVSLVMVDSFDTDQSILSQTVGEDAIPGSISSSVSSEDILGGERDLEVNITKGKTPGNRLGAGISAGVASVSYGSSIAGSVNITWDGPDGDAVKLDPVGLGGLDLTAGGRQDAFLLSIELDDLPAGLDIQIYSDVENSSSFSLSLPGAIYSSTQYVIPFSAFIAELGEGANFSNVGAITLAVSADKPLDMMISSFETHSTLTAIKTDTLLIDKNEDGQANPGDSLQYTVSIANPADSFGAEATGLIFADTYDENTTLVTGSVTSSQGTVSSGNGEGDAEVSVEIGSLADGDSVTIVFEAIVNDPLPDEVTEVANQGFVSGDTLTNLPTDDPETDLADDATTTPVFPAAAAPAEPVVTATKSDLLPDGSSDGQIAPDEVLTYTVVIAASDVEASGVVFTDTLDVNAALVISSVTTSQGEVISGNKEGDTEVAINVGDIAAGDSVTIVFEAVIRDPLPEEVIELANQGRVTGSNFAEVVTDDPDTDATNDPTVTQVVSP
jgi:uncharacterized repeat protein (TIGR01451 family)